MKAEWTNKDSLSIESTGQKAILVIDEMPKMCIGCPLNLADSSIRCRHTWTGKSIPSWCPLRKIPQKESEKHREEIEDWTGLAYSQGWNDCIDAIISDTDGTKGEK